MIPLKKLLLSHGIPDGRGPAEVGEERRLTRRGEEPGAMQTSMGVFESRGLKALLVSIFVISLTAFIFLASFGAPRPSLAQRSGSPPGQPPPSPPQVLSLTLSQAIGLALQENPAMKAMSNRVTAAEARVRLAGSASNPALSLDIQETMIDPVTVFAGKQINNRLTPDLRLQLNNVLTSFGRLEAQKGAAQYTLKGIIEERRTLAQHLRFQVEEAFFLVFKARGEGTVAKENLEISTQNLQVSRDLFKAGVAPRFDILRHEAAIASSREKLIAVENREKLAMATLLNLLSLPHETPVTLVLPEENPGATPVPSLEEGEKKALQQRPEIHRMQSLMEASQKVLLAAEKEDDPTLSFSTSYSLRGGTSFNPSRFWQAGILFHWPFLDGGRAEALAEEGKALLQALEHEMEELRNQVALEVKQASLVLTEVRERLEAARRNREAAQEALNVARVRYQAGLSTAVELQDATAAMTDARVREENLKYDEQVAWARWRLVIGEGEAIGGKIPSSQEIP